MGQFHGIIMYEILENGNLLNGIYTNTHSSPPFVIDSEILSKENFDNSGVLGEYKGRYIETNPDPSIVTHCTVTITRRGAAYIFVWTNEMGERIWEGIGLRADSNHIAVSYINPR